MPGQISVVGGNVDDAVTLKHVPVTPDGRLATPDGQVIDPRYKWMVVLRAAVRRAGVIAVSKSSPPLAGGEGEGASRL